MQMGKTEAREWVRRIEDGHRGDRDGGYALVRAICQARAELEPGPASVVSEVLADVVRQKEGLWGVALDALVDCGAASEVASLADAMPRHDDEWRDNVVLAFLRLGQAQLRDRILEHLQAALPHPRTVTVPTLAALCKIDREACIELGARFFEKAHADGRCTDVEGYIPTFVQYFVEVDDQLLSELVRRMARLRPAAGHWLALCFDAHFAKPWIPRELGAERAARLRNEVLAAGR
jgi:hypothetical protein